MRWLRSAFPFLLASSAAASSSAGACAPGEGSGCAAAVELEDEVQFLQERVSLKSRLQHLQKAEARGAASEQAAPHKLGLNQSGAAAATTTTTTWDAFSSTGVTTNEEGGLVTFIEDVIIYGGVCLVFVAFFNVARTRYPMVYAHNSMTGLVSFTPDESRWGWVTASMEIKVEEVIETIGLDNALMIEFANLMMKIFATIGVPMFCIIGPMNCIFGGNAAGAEHFSWFSFGNVEFGSWLYWVHAFVSWGVVFVITSNLHQAQKKFLEYRYAWLRKMPEKRANTIMVDHIPEHLRNDKKLADFFEDIIPGDDNVKCAYVTKDTTHLLHLVNELKRAEEKLQEAEGQWEKSKADGKTRCPTFWGWCFGKEVDSIDHYTALIEDLQPKVAAEREKVQNEAKEVGGINQNSGFITFNDRTSAEVAKRLTAITEDKEELILEDPPEPADILWNDFTQDQNARQGRELMGYALTAALFVVYMPVVIIITSIADTIELPGVLDTLWECVAPTMGLHFMVAMLPTFLMTIYKLCFTLKAAAWVQHKVQSWYFWFQMFFVLLITAVGTNVVEFLEVIFTDPFSTFGILADTLHSATHYYMYYLTCIWMAQGMVLVRCSPLTKFKFFSQIFSEEEAKKRAEPEAQDYYGIGTRSAQWVTYALIGVIYGTMSPLVTVLTFFTFCIIRLFFGYLLVFAETKKADLGGVFWVTSLRQMFVGTFVYTIVMTGIYYRRGNNYGPMLICAPSIVYALWSKMRFESAYAWENLPFQVLSDEATLAVKKRELEGEYVQPEMINILDGRHYRCCCRFGALARIVWTNAVPNGKSGRARSRHSVEQHCVCFGYG